MVADAPRSACGVRAGEHCRGLVQDFTEGLGSVRSMRRAERSQGDVQLALAEADFASPGEQLTPASVTSAHFAWETGRKACRKNQGKDVMLTNCSDPLRSAEKRGPDALKRYRPWGHSGW